MTLIRTFFLTLLLVAGSVVTLAQSTATKSSATPDPTVTVSVSEKGVRFAALGGIGQMRLEVFNASGESLYNSDFQRGNVRDWALEDKLGQPLADGSYLCAVTFRDLSGKLGIKQGTVLVQSGQASLKLSEGQQIGAIESDKSLAPVSESNPPAVTLAAHDGTDGAVVSTRGGLSFRIGDFFAGLDRESMRLTPEGNLGIGITHPLVRLDVDGLIRASHGVVFPDGSIQYSAATKTYGAKSSLPDASFQSFQSKSGKKSSGGQEHIEAAGTGTLNHIAKWTETGGSGTLGDTGVLETAGGNVGIGTTTPDPFKLNVNGSLNIGGSNLYLGGFLRFTDNVGAGYTNFVALNGNLTNFDGVNYEQLNLYNPGGDKAIHLAQTAAGSQIASIGAGNTTLSLQPSGGNVGIGTNNPQARLDVAGDVQVSGNIAAKYQDVAEWVPATEKLAAGTVVSLDATRSNTVAPSRRAYDTHIAGVVSPQPGLTLGEGGEGKLLIATTGRVKVKVDATRRPIRIGDLLVSSGRLGTAMRSEPIRVGGRLIHRPGTIIGKALEPLSKGHGEILVLLSLQ